jgi:hypothetical protein
MGDAGAAAYEKIEERVRLATEAHAGLKLAGRQLRSLFAAGVDEAGLADRLGLSVEQLGAGLKAGTIDAQKFGNALSATLVEKGRGPLQAMSDSMSVFADKFREEGRQLFDGIDTSPITDMLHELLDVGSQAEPSGRAIKGALTDALNGIIEKAGELGQDAQAEFLEIEADAVEMGVTVKGVGRVIGEAFDIGKAAASGLVTVIEAGLRPLILFGKAAEKIVEAGVGLGFDIAAHALADVDPKTGLPPGAPSFDGPAAAPAPSGGLAGTLGVHAPEPSGGLAGGDLYSLHAPANAEGGLVQPAKGELFASVAPGEMIVPREITRRATGEDREPAPANDNGGRAGVHVDHLELHVHAKDGVTGAEELSVVGVMAALERLQLAAGR